MSVSSPPLVLLSPGGRPTGALNCAQSVDKLQGLDDLNRVLPCLACWRRRRQPARLNHLPHFHSPPQLRRGRPALAKATTTFPLDSRGGDEVRRGSAAFDGMRAASQKPPQLIESERLATIGAWQLHFPRPAPLPGLDRPRASSSVKSPDGTQREELYSEFLPPSRK